MVVEEEVKVCAGLAMRVVEVLAVAGVLAERVEGFIDKNLLKVEVDEAGCGSKLLLLRFRGMLPVSASARSLALKLCFMPLPLPLFIPVTAAERGSIDLRREKRLLAGRRSPEPLPL